MNDSHVYRAVCKYCLKEQGMAEHEYVLPDGETLSIYQCMQCKMIQPQED